MNPNRVQSEYGWTRNVVNVVGAGPFSVAPADSNRVYLLFANLTGANIVLEPVPDFITDGSTGSPLGLVLAAGGHFRLRLCDDGPIVQAEWFAWDATGVPQAPGTTLLMIIESTATNPENL